MTEIDIDMPDLCRTDHATARIERVMRQHDLLPVSRGTLRKYPGCIHWHFKRLRQKGTLEVTFWPEARRAWFKIQSSRHAGWMDELIPVLKRALRR